MVRFLGEKCINLYQNLKCAVLWLSNPPSSLPVLLCIQVFNNSHWIIEQQIRNMMIIKDGSFWKIMLIKQNTLKPWKRIKSMKPILHLNYISLILKSKRQESVCSMLAFKHKPNMLGYVYLFISQKYCIQETEGKVFL